MLTCTNFFEHIPSKARRAAVTGTHKQKTMSARIHTDGNVMTLMTVDVVSFRNMVSVLKDIMRDMTIMFDEHGMHIVNLDMTQTILAHVCLPADKFDFYECKRNKIIIGVITLHLFKLISSVEKNDVLTLCIEESDYIDGYVSHLTVKFENRPINQFSTQKLKLRDGDILDFTYPSVDFSSVIRFPSKDFYKVIHDLNKLEPPSVEFETVSNELIFRCHGEFADSEIHRDASGNAMSVLKQDPEGRVVQGLFPLRQLMFFAKCTSLCDEVEINLESQLPLMVKYDVGSLGEMQLCLGQSSVS